MALPSHSPLSQAKRQPLGTAPNRSRPVPALSQRSVSQERFACASQTPRIRSRFAATSPIRPDPSLRELRPELSTSPFARRVHR
jgi:hypothetical protein